MLMEICLANATGLPLLQHTERIRIIQDKESIIFFSSGSLNERLSPEFRFWHINSNSKHFQFLNDQEDI
jgi:hypothetical protein